MPPITGGVQWTNSISTLTIHSVRQSPQTFSHAPIQLWRWLKLVVSAERLHKEVLAPAGGEAFKPFMDATAPLRAFMGRVNAHAIQLRG